MISIIVAVAENGIIGGANRMPWHISEDMMRFKAITLGHPVVMGRRTFESLGRPLSGRTNVIITRDIELKIDGATTVGSLSEAIGMFPATEEVFVIGGGEIYAQTIEIADRMYVTKVHMSPKGDTHFPEIDPSKWIIESTETHDKFSYVNYVRCQP